MLDEIKGRLAGFLSRKLVYGLICESVASYLAIAKLLTGSEWVTVTLGLAGLVISGNAVTKFAGGSK
jgi:hypothetical protein